MVETQGFPVSWPRPISSSSSSSIGRLFSRYWKEEFIVLYDDSSVAWFKDKNRTEPEVIRYGSLRKRGQVFTFT